jgi:hypothetical protein
MFGQMSYLLSMQKVVPRFQPVNSRGMPYATTLLQFPTNGDLQTANKS